MCDISGIGFQSQCHPNTPPGNGHVNSNETINLIMLIKCGARYGKFNATENMQLFSMNFKWTFPAEWQIGNIQ